jgi:DNA replication protein DnaC
VIEFVLPVSGETLCACGQPCCSFYSEVFKKTLRSRVCEECSAKENERLAEAERREKQKKINYKIKQCIPEIYQNASLCDLNTTLQEMLFNRPPVQGVILYGPVGTGKTYAATAMMRSYLETSRTARFISLKDLLLDLRETYGTDTTERQILRPLLAAGLLVVDDVGTVKSGGRESDFTSDTLLSIIDDRQKQNKPTILTTNLQPEELGHCFGDRVGSRIQMFMIIHMDGKDKRSQVDFR